jgi:Zn-finger nucleic acid-binding protein
MKSEKLLLSCPYCKKPIASDARLCVHCNGPIFDEGDKSRAPFCPRCKTKLKVFEIEGGDQAQVCENCNGLWLDAENFKRTTNPQRVPKKFFDSKTHWHQPSETPFQYLSCPRCGRYMNRENYSRISGIIIDHCRDHGVWLDAGELDRIRLFIASGGMEKFQDKRLDMIEEKLQSLAGKTRELEFTTKLLHFWNIKRIIFQNTIFR